MNDEKKSRSELIEELGRASEEWQKTFDASSDAIFVLDQDQRISRNNKKAKQLFQRPSAKLIGKHCWEIVHGTTEPIPGCPCLRARDSLSRETMDLQVGKSWLRVTVDPILDATGRYDGAVHLITDITERKQTEKRLEHLALVLRAVRNVNQLITQEKDRDRLLNGACEILTEDRGYFNAWIVLLDEKHNATAVFESGLGENFEPMLERLKRGDLTSCAKETLERKEVVVIEDPPTECGDCPLAGQYTGRGGLSARLEHDGVIYGILTVSIPVEFSRDEEELSLFKEVADDIAFALHNLKKEEEHKRSDKALQESEELLSESQRIAHIGSWSLDIEANKLTWSDEAFRIFGLEPQEFEATYDGFLDCVHPEDRAAVDAAYSSSLQEGKAGYEIEHRVVRRGTGEIRHVHERCFHIRNSAGVTVKSIGMVQDITDRKKLGEALEKSEERHREMFHNMGSCVVVYSAVDDGADFTIVDLNPAAERSEHIKKEEIIGKRVTDAFPGVTDYGLLAVFSEVWKTGEPQHHPISMYKDERITGWRENYVYRLPSGEVIAVYSDLTKEKQAEEALVESEEKYRLLAENATDIIWMTDASLKGTYTSPSVVRIRGYTPDEATAQSIEDTLTPESLGVAMNMFQEEMALVAQGDYPEGKVRTCDLEFTCKDGSTVWTETSMRFLFDDERNPIGALGISRDITDRRRAEKEKAALEDQLLQSQKMESVGRLAGGVAHDFNNLLTVILSSCSFMSEDLREGDPLLDDVRDIKNAGDRAVALTRQLLAFSRRQMLQKEVIDLNLTLKNLDKMLRRLIREDIDIETDLEPNLWKVEADPGQVEQVVVNLAVNASDAMEGGGKLTIETANVELDEEYARTHVTVTPGPYVMLAVSDTGCGMDAETTAQAFDPFFTTKEKGKGTGLGLSMVYGIVKQHGGNIWIYSEPGMGTIFKIYLPMATTTEKTASMAPEPVGNSHGAETVLVVEDERALLKLAVRVLERKGYNVLQARDGLEGQTVANAHEGPIHLLLTDVVMPNMSGVELAQKLLSTRPDLKVLYMSGYTDNAIVHHGVLDKGTHFVQKPFGIDVLLQKVREVLDSQDDGPRQVER